MSDPYAASPEIADDEDDRPSAALEREGDAILNGEDHHVASLRRAVRDDLDEGRQWFVARSAQARAAVQDEPVRATLYALGLGVILGLILSR